MLVGTIEATLLILLLIIVFGPIVAQRFRIPGLVGLIAGGIVFGPFMLGWLPTDSLVTDLGAIGILFLMFLAGLSFNIRAFRANRSSAITYGLIGFLLPFLISIVVMVWGFEFGLLGASLVGAMWASNTLIAYPDVKAAGMQNNRAISAAVSAGVVADLLSLSVLAIATATAVIELDPELPELFGVDLPGLVEGDVLQPSVSEPLLSLWVALPFLVFFTMWILPRVTEWFFINVGRTRMQRFVFMLAGMAAGGTVALLGGIEGLIGAFLAGLGMNRHVPERGQLMANLDMVGTWLFVPAFLVSIGLNIDPALLFNAETLKLTALFTLFVVVGKGSAAIITGLRFGFTWNEIGAMSSLSFGQAASTLAIAQVGYELRMFDELVVNAAVLTIVTTALLTSYGTTFFVRRIPRPVEPPTRVGESVLVDVRQLGSDAESLMQFAGSIAKPDDGLVIPFSIQARGQLEMDRGLVDQAAEAAAAFGLDVEGEVRVDDSFADGALELAEEVGASTIVLAWSGPRFANDYLLGNSIDLVGQMSNWPTVAARILRPWDRIIVATGNLDTDWHREDAQLALAVVRRLRWSQPVPVVAVTPDSAFVEGNVGDEDGVEIVHEPEQRKAIFKEFEASDLVITTAHVVHDLSPRLSRQVTRSLQDVNIAVVAGPHRMTLSRGVVRQPMQTMVHPTG